MRTHTVITLTKGSRRFGLHLLQEYEYCYLVGQILAFDRNLAKSSETHMTRLGEITHRQRSNVDGAEGLGIPT